MREWLESKFDQSFISRFAPVVPWPPKSPDSSPLEYLPWFFLSETLQKTILSLLKPWKTSALVSVAKPYRKLFSVLAGEPLFAINKKVLLSSKNFRFCYFQWSNIKWRTFLNYLDPCLIKFDRIFASKIASKIWSYFMHSRELKFNTQIWTHFFRKKLYSISRI